MSTRTTTYKVCDACGRSDLHDNIIAWQTIERPRFGGSEIHTIDICDECQEAELYYCRQCRQIHNDDNPCKQQSEAASW